MRFWSVLTCLQLSDAEAGFVLASERVASKGLLDGTGADLKVTDRDDGGPLMSVTEEIKSYWEAKSLTPLDDQGLRPTGRDSFLQQALEEAILKHLPADKKILDVGCGDGSSTSVFARRARSVVAVDYVENYVKQAKELCAKAGLKNV